MGYELRPRLPVYPEYFMDEDAYVAASLKAKVEGLADPEGYVRGGLNVMPGDNTDRSGAANVGELIRFLDPKVAGVLDYALAGGDISPEDALVLFDTVGLEYNAMTMVADELRRRSVGDAVTYVGKPQHQLHQRVHQTLWLLRVQPRLPRGTGLLSAG